MGVEPARAAITDLEAAELTCYVLPGIRSSWNV